MRKILFFFSAFFFALLICSFCQAQNTSLKDVVVKLQSFYSNHTFEKSYLQFDRPYYAAGDTIYFKAYVTYGEQHELSRQSNILFVDLIGPDNKIRHSLKLQLINGLAWGDFVLSDSLSRGIYRIRAYTRLIKISGVVDFFEQVIPVGPVAEEKSAAGVVAKPEIQFFPEGGDLVYGLNSKIAFKAISASGLGLNVKGVVVDNNGKTVANFVSSHLGMGLFNFTPVKGGNYTANVTFEDGSQNSYSLPVPTHNGVFVSVNNDDPDQLTLAISCDSGFYALNQNKYFGVVINSGISVTSANIKLAAPLLAVDLSKKPFRTGIVQFTLFSPTGEALSERLIFVQQDDKLKLKINSDKLLYHSRDKVSVSLQAKNKKDSLVTGHFSVSVIDGSKVPVDENRENTILSWLLLSSDLKGNIEQPNYYFNHINKETQANLDILMLTQGYRRFVWKQLLNNQYQPQVTEPDKGLEIKGLVTDLQGKPIPKGKVNLINLEGGPMLNNMTDTAGRFSFTGLNFSDSTRFILKAASEKDRNKTRIAYLVDQPESVSPGKSVLRQQVGLDSMVFAYVQNRKLKLDNNTKSGLVTDDAVPKKAKAEGNKAAAIQGGRIGGKADQIITKDELRETSLLSNQLNGLIPGVTFSGGVPFLKMPISLDGNPPMLVIIDGVKMPLYTGVDEIDIHDVAAVEIFKNSSASAFGALGGGGVLYITSMKGSNRGVSKNMAVGTLQVNAHGYYKAREFYSPRYKDNLNNTRPDSRATIYWNPELVTDKDGNVSFEFYNADGKGIYRVVVEGIDNAGNIGRQVYTYKVE